jgi:hypothetical protein
MAQQYYTSVYKGQGYRAQLKASIIISPKILQLMKTNLWPIKCYVDKNTNVIKNRTNVTHSPLNVPPFPV